MLGLNAGFPIVTDPSTSVSKPEAATSRRSWGARRIVRDGVWLVMGEALAAVGMLVGVRIITRAVSPATFAAASLLFGFVVFVRNLFYQPFLQAAFRFYPEAVKNDTTPTLRRILLRYVRRASAVAIPTGLVLGIAASALGKVSIDVSIFLLVLLLVESLRAVEIGLLNAARRQRTYAMLRPYDTWGRPLAALAMVHLLGPTEFAILVGYFAVSLSGYGVIFLLGAHPVGYDPNRPASTDDPLLVAELRKRIFRFALPMMPFALLEWIVVYGDRYILGAFEGLEVTGIYTAGCGLAATPFLMAQVTIESWLRQIYFEAVEFGNRERSRRVFLGYSATTAGLCLLGVAGLFLLGQWIVDTLLDARYRELGPLLPVIGFGSSLFAMCQVVEKVFHAHHRMQLCLASRAVGAVACIATAVPMISKFGLSGAAWAAPIYFGIQLLATIALTRLIDESRQA
jgi:O-antigen/teichoic acid export membrane protein